MVLGKVINDNPLSISIGDLFLDREDLMVNENIKGFNRNDTLAMVPTENRQIKDMLITPNKWSRPQTKIGTIKKIVIHWIGNAGSTAENNAKYFNVVDTN